MKKVMNFFCRITLMILAFVTSASSGVMMADASNLPDAGKVTGATPEIIHSPSGNRMLDIIEYLDIYVVSGTI